MNFDQVIERRGTSSNKWNQYAGRDILPMWVADMDFASPPSVLAALHERVDHGVFGYTDPPDRLVEAVRTHARRHCRWEIEPDWFVWLPGLVPSVNLLGYTAAEAAYRHDGAWHAALIDDLRGNRELLREWFARSGRLKLTVPEATYLAWIDARAIDPDDPLPAFEALGVGLSDGRDFGLKGYVKLNFGCRSASLEDALKRIEPLW